MYRHEGDPELRRTAPGNAGPWELQEVENEGPRRSGGSRLVAAFTALAMVLVIAVPAFGLMRQLLGPGQTAVFVLFIALAVVAVVQVLRRRRE